MAPATTGGGSGAGSPAAHAPSAASTAPPAAAKAAGLKPIDICSAISVAKVSALTGRDYVSSEENDVASAHIHECVYRGEGGEQSLLALDLNVDYGGGAADLTAEVNETKGDDENPVPLTNLGSSNAKGIQSMVIAQYGQDDAYAIDALFPGDTTQLSTAQLAQLVRTIVAASR